ncbi:hypothetical protein PsorP6_006790 [Peronosclerospora sorghi]|uniref:Uncharacterized protein n=1 Tax=Peronosclerospora sorghi TaxID=230839 RepID=A0ACC0W6Z6_9STRA|nr:hypothetical protein PsorP6_006790 [Peronosclerospora sorghi]
MHGSMPHVTRMEEELRHATEMLRHAEEKREKWNQLVNTLAALLCSHGTALLEHTKTPATNLPMQFTSATFPTTAASATSETSPSPPSEWFVSGLTSEVESSDGTSAESVEDNPMKDSSDESDDNVPATHGEESVFAVAASLKQSVNGNTMEDPSNDNILETKGELAENKDVPATHGEQNVFLTSPCRANVHWLIFA